MTELLYKYCRHLRRVGREKKIEMWKYTLNPMDSLHSPSLSPSLSPCYNHTHIHANTPLLAWGLAPSSGLNDIIGCQGYKDTACREKGGWGIGRAMHIAWKRKEGGWHIGYQERKGALLKQVVKIAEAMGQGHEEERQEKRKPASLSKVTGPSFLSPLSYISFHSLSLSREGQNCNSAACVVGKERRE